MTRRENNPGIYFIINLEDGKVYVGQTVSLKTRLSGHFSLLRRNIHSNRHLQYAFNKHGESSFHPYIAEFCLVEKLTEREQFWIDFFPKEKIYNTAPAAGSCLGVVHTEETRLKVSRSNKGRVQSQHVRDAVSASNKTRPLKDETRKKISAALSKRVVLEKTRKKLSDANKGRRLSESHKKSLSYSRSRKISAFGKTLTIQEWSQENGIPVSTISKRISYGWEISDAVSRKRRNYNASPRGFE